MHYSGMSVNNICSYLKQQYGYFPSKSVVCYWIDEYMPTGIKKHNTKPNNRFSNNYRGADSLCDCSVKSDCLNCPLPECIHVTKTKKCINKLVIE